MRCEPLYTLMVLFAVQSCKEPTVKPIEAQELPTYGVYKCKYCRKLDTVFFYWNLDTNTARAQNIRKYGRK